MLANMSRWWVEERCHPEPELWEQAKCKLGKEGCARAKPLDLAAQHRLSGPRAGYSGPPEMR